jgi:hypothetical protein
MSNHFTKRILTLFALMALVSLPAIAEERVGNGTGGFTDYSSPWPSRQEIPIQSESEAFRAYCRTSVRLYVRYVERYSDNKAVGYILHPEDEKEELKWIRVGSGGTTLQEAFRRAFAKIVQGNPDMRIFCEIKKWRPRTVGELPGQSRIEPCIDTHNLDNSCDDRAIALRTYLEKDGVRIEDNPRWGPSPDAVQRIVEEIMGIAMTTVDDSVSGVERRFIDLAFGELRGRQRRGLVEGLLKANSYLRKESWNSFTIVGDLPFSEVNILSPNTEVFQVTKEIKVAPWRHRTGVTLQSGVTLQLGRLDEVQKELDEIHRIMRDNSFFETANQMTRQKSSAHLVADWELIEEGQKKVNELNKLLKKEGVIYRAYTFENAGDKLFDFIRLTKARLSAFERIANSNLEEASLQDTLVEENGANNSFFVLSDLERLEDLQWSLRSALAQLNYGMYTEGELPEQYEPLSPDACPIIRSAVTDLLSLQEGFFRHYPYPKRFASTDLLRQITLALESINVYRLSSDAFSNFLHALLPKWQEVCAEEERDLIEESLNRLRAIEEGAI